MKLEHHPADDRHVQHAGTSQSVAFFVEAEDARRYVELINVRDALADRIVPPPEEDTRVYVDGGKYTVVFRASGKLEAHRYGQQWRDLTGDNLVYHLALELDEARRNLSLAIEDRDDARAKLSTTTPS